MVTIYSSLTEHGIHVMDSFEFEYGRILNDHLHFEESILF